MAENKQDTMVDKYLPDFMDEFQKKAEISLQKSLEPSGKVCKFVGGRSEQKWIPVTERLPDWRDGKVLVSTKYGFSICERTVNGRWKGQHANWITHWMPLPEPPKEVE